MILEYLAIMLVCMIGPPLVAYLVAQAWTYGKLLAQYRFQQKIKEEESKDGK